MMDGEPKFSPQDTRSRKRYTVGDKTNHWGEPDEFNEELKDAQESGLVDANGCLTEKGALYLEELDANARENQLERRLPLSTHLPDGVVEGQPHDPSFSSHGQSAELKFATSSSAREIKIDMERGNKELVDDILTALIDRGFKVDSVDLQKDTRSPGGEDHFILEIHYKPGNGNGAKKRRTLRLVGSEKQLVRQIDTTDFNLPTTSRREKAERARRRSS